MNHLIIRHPHLVGFVAYWGFLWGFGFFYNTAKLEIRDTCPQGHESTFFQDIYWKSYSTKGGTVVRRYHEKIMESYYRYSLLGFKSASTANFREMGAHEKTAANPALMHAP